MKKGTRLRNGTLVEVLPTGSRITLPGGAVVEGAPHDTNEYRTTALRLGYGTDTLEMCRQHDPLHSLLCDWLGLGDSRSLRAAAGLEKESNVSAAEECAVIALQKFMRLTGVGLPMCKCDKIKVGDIVRLNSGSPLLTVMRIYEGPRSVLADVTWIGQLKNQVERATFPLVCVTKGEHTA